MSNFCINPRHVSVHIIRTHHNGNKFLLLHRNTSYLHGIWQMATGEIHEGEKAYESAFRIIREQAGLFPDRLYCADAVETFYMQTTDKILLIPVFVAFVDTMPAEVQLSLTAYDNYEWVAYDVALARLAFSEQKRILTHIRNNFILNDPNPLHLINKIT